jgi:hypothetical protein
MPAVVHGQHDSPGRQAADGADLVGVANERKPAQELLPEMRIGRGRRKRSGRCAKQSRKRVTTATRREPGVDL